MKKRAYRESIYGRFELKKRRIFEKYKINHTHHTPQAVKYRPFGWSILSFFYITMKAKITDKAAKQLRPLWIGYGEAQFLLTYQNPICYTCWMYGWKADIYRIWNYFISTGYGYVWERPGYKLVRAYDDKARKIYCSNYWRKSKKTRINNLLDEFIKKARENIKSK